MGYWIPTCIRVGIDPTTQPNRIALDISADRLVIVSKVVVAGVGFAVEVLPRETVVVLEVGTRVRRVLVRCVVPKRIIVLPLPHLGVCRVACCYGSRRAQMIGI